jgi:hypothetical protein
MKAFFIKMWKKLEEYNTVRAEIYVKRGMWL